MTNQFHFGAICHRPVYPAITTPQQAYILFEACPSASAADATSAPINYCLVLDRSGSMAGEKLRKMKDAVQLVIDRLGPDDLVSVVIFDDVEPADLILPSSSAQDRVQLKRKIEMIEERGGTHMSTGMRLGLSELKRGQQPGYVNSMLLVTDGQTWEDQQECRDLADQCRAAGIPIYAMGLGVGDENNWDPRLLEYLAQRSGGEWLVIETPSQVSEIFEKILKSGRNMAMTNARLTMRFAHGVVPRSVWRTTPSICRLDHHEVGEHDIQVFLGDLQFEVGQLILAEVILPPRPTGAYRLIQADINYDLPGSRLTDQKAAVDLVIQFSDQALQISQMENRVMNIIERVVAHKLQTRALDEAEMGDIVHATQRLRAVATRLLELGEAEMAQAAEQQAQQIEQNGRVNLAAAQKMRYATRRLVNPDF